MSYFNRTTLMDVNGHPFASYQDADGDYCLATSTTQNVTADKNNTATSGPSGSGAVNVVLTPGSSWTGVATTVLGANAIQVMFKCDQYCTVFVYQSGDGTNFDVVDSFKYFPTQNFGTTVQAVGTNYYVKVTNNGLASTTTFRLESFIVPVVEALPRALDQFGNLRVGLNGLADQYGFLGTFDDSHQLSVEEPYRLVGVTFPQTTNDTNFWTLANFGAGSGADVGTTTPSVATLVSGTANNGNASLTTVRKARFIFRSPNRFVADVRLPALSIAGCTRNLGAAVISAESTSGVTTTDGFWFSVNGSNVLSVNWQNNGGTVGSVASGSFNGQVSQFTVDTNYHVYEIIFGHSAAYFFIDGTLIHSQSTTTVLLSSLFTLPACSWVVNSASGTASGSIQLASMSIYRLGKEITEATSKYISATNNPGGVALKIGLGNVRRVVISNTGTNSQIVLYDGTTTGSVITGTIIFDTGGMGSTQSPVVMDLDGTPFFTGLVLLSTGHATNVAIVYE